MARPDRSIRFGVLSAACLALGAAVNIAVAWSCVAWGTLVSLDGQGVRPPTARPEIPGSGWSAPSFNPLARSGAGRLAADEDRRSSTSPGVLWLGGRTDWNPPKYYADGLWAGWPMRSMGGPRTQRMDSAGLVTVRSRGLGPLLSRSEARAMPGAMSRWGWGGDGSRAGCR